MDSNDSAKLTRNCIIQHNSLWRLSAYRRLGKRELTKWQKYLMFIIRKSTYNFAILCNNGFIILAEVKIVMLKQELDNALQNLTLEKTKFMTELQNWMNSTKASLSGQIVRLVYATITFTSCQIIKIMLTVIYITI